MIAALGLIGLVAPAPAPDLDEARPTPPASSQLAAEISRPSPTPVPDSPVLALLSARCGVSVGYMTCEGSVRNLTSQPLHDLEVVILWADASGVVQTAEDVLVTYNPLLPAQVSPWKVISRHNPALTKYRVEFKELFGGTVLVRDDRNTE